MEPDANKKRKLFFKELSTALWSAGGDEGNIGSYAGGGDIALRQHGSILEAVHVEGVGDLRLPLSSDDMAKLLSHPVCKRASYGHGLATKLDLQIRRAWQVDASKVTFPSSPDFLSKTVPLIVQKAVQALGIDGLVGDIEAHLYKLLLYEVGGHFVLHRDTEKEPGMFATLIVQLPTQEGFEGGELVVHQGETTKTFSFSSGSDTKFFYSIFYADCEHELLKITKGTRLCLSFNLVRGIREGFNIPLTELIKKGHSSKLSKVESVLEPWLQTRLSEDMLKEGDIFSETEKLAIPLEHKYSKTNLSFSGLKEKDRIVAQILQNCRDASGSRSFDLYLCIFTLHKFGDSEHYGGKMENFDIKFETSTWVGTNDKPCNFTLEINDSFEVVTGDDVRNLYTKINKPDEELEGSSDVDDKEFGRPDDYKFEGYTGNEGPSVDYWYHKAILVIWPKKKSISMACRLSAPCALDILEIQAQEADPLTVTTLHEILNYYLRHGEAWHFFSDKVLEGDVWNFNGGKMPKKRTVSSGIQTVTSRLVELTMQVGDLESALLTLKLLSEVESSEVESSEVECRGHIVGINSTNTATAVAGVVQKYGWMNCEPYIMKLVMEDQVKDQAEYFVHFALELMRLGCEDAGLLVAKRTLEMIAVAFASFDQVGADMVVNIGRILFSFEGCREEMGVEYVERFWQLKTDVLYSSIVKLNGIFQDEITASSTKGGVTCASLFRNMCDIIITKDSHCPPMSESQVVMLAKTFILLGDEQLLDNLIQAVVNDCQSHKQQHLLTALLGSEEMNEYMSRTASGRSKLRFLLEDCIRMTSEPAPPFTWCMPLAQLPEHPQVETFLRGPLERFKYCGMRGSCTDFVNKYFKFRGYQNGYSANAKNCTEMFTLSQKHMQHMRMYSLGRLRHSKRSSQG